MCRTELTLSERALLTVRVRDADAIVAPQPLLTPEETALRIAIMGSGGIGGYLGARLAQAGEDVIFIARGAHLEAMQRHGLRVESPLGEIILRHVRATETPRISALSTSWSLPSRPTTPKGRAWLWSR